MIGDTAIASATCVGVWFVDVTADRALFVASLLQAVVVALVPDKIFGDTMGRQRSEWGTGRVPRDVWLR